MPQGYEASPEPPPDVLYLGFDKVIIPRETRDGRKWDAVGGNAPDPFAKVVVDGKELFSTPVESNTLHPTWPDQTWANYQVLPGKRVAIEVWDSNPVANRPICSTVLMDIHQRRDDGRVELSCEGGARVLFRVEPARAVLGLGFSYEIGTQQIRVTKVLEHSPAGRAGLGAGTRLLALQGKPVSEMDAAEVRSTINANARTGLRCKVQKEDGTEREVTLKEGAVYPLAGQGVELQ